MKRKLRRLAREFAEQGYNTSVTEADGKMTLSIWCRNHKPGDNTTDVYYDIASGSIRMENGLQLLINL